jgi:DNA repair protein RecO (recombination protein O)
MPAPPRVYKTEALIIAQREIGEADRLLSLYTPYFGKLKAVAKGVRRPKSKMGGHLELLSQSTILLARGQNLDTITQAQLIESFLPLRQSLWRLSCGLYVAELIDRFTPEHLANFQLYRLLVDTLTRLGQAKKGDVVLRFFEVNLLNLTGFRPQLKKCSRCNLDIQPGPIFFSSSSGGLVCSGCQRSDVSEGAAQTRPVTLNAVKVLRFFQDNSFETSARIRMDKELSSEIENLLRSFLHYVLEQEIKSTSWLDQLRREKMNLSR